MQKFIKQSEMQEMFREVLTKLVDKKWRTPEQADDVWMQYKKLVSEVKQFHKDKFAGLKFGGGSIRHILL